MKYFNWDTAKNEWLIEKRKISFEEIVFKIMRGDLLDILEHPNKEKYPEQKIFVVNVKNYAHLVPFIETEKTIFLKTVIPSRKMTRKYLGDNNG